MVATTTQLTNSIDKFVSQLRADYPEFKFTLSNIAHWSAHDQTVYFSKSSDKITLIHELGHAIRGHRTFIQDIELLRIECEAWQTARQIAPKYQLSIKEDTVQNALDSYRDWLHARSRCPNCKNAGIQSRENYYRCPLCLTAWQANDARQCGLRRRIKKPA